MTSSILQYARIRLQHWESLLDSGKLPDKCTQEEAKKLSDYWHLRVKELEELESGSKRGESNG